MIVWETELRFIAEPEQRQHGLRHGLNALQQVLAVHQTSATFLATAERGGLFVLTLHDWIAGRPAQLRVLDALLERIRADGATWVTTGQEIADHHRRDLNLRG